MLARVMPPLFCCSVTWYLPPAISTCGWEVLDGRVASGERDLVGSEPIHAVLDSGRRGRCDSNGGERWHAGRGPTGRRAAAKRVALHVGRREEARARDVGSKPVAPDGGRELRVRDACLLLKEPRPLARQRECADRDEHSGGDGDHELDEREARGPPSRLDNPCVAHVSGLRFCGIALAT
jgi:hypothetical protein